MEEDYIIPYTGASANCCTSVSLLHKALFSQIQLANHRPSLSRNVQMNGKSKCLNISKLYINTTEPPLCAW